MNQYEITFITREDIDPGVASAIQEAEGRIESERKLGRRQFTQPIGKQTAGYYTTLRFRLAPAVLADLNRQFQLQSAILRFLLVSVPEAKLPTTSLEVEYLKEAKELEPQGAEPSGLETPKEPAKATDTERDKQLQEQLDKLLAGDQTEDK